MRRRTDQPARSGMPSAAAPSAASSRSSDIPLRETLRPSGPVRFELRIEHRPGVVVAHVEGELDVLTGPKLTAPLNALVRAGTTDVVLDLRKVRFMDSAGLQILLITRRRLLRESRTLSVVCSDGPVSRLLELARLEETLHVTKS